MYLHLRKLTLSFEENRLSLSLFSLNTHCFADSIHLRCGLYKQLSVPGAAFSNSDSHKTSTRQLLPWIRNAEIRGQILPEGTQPLCTLVELCEAIWPFSGTVCSIYCNPLIATLVTLLRAISPQTWLCSRQASGSAHHDMQEEIEGAVAFSSQSHSPDALKSLNQSHSPDAIKSLGARPALLRACKYVNVLQEQVSCTYGRSQSFAFVVVPTLWDIHSLVLQSAFLLFSYLLLSLDNSAGGYETT